MSCMRAKPISRATRTEPPPPMKMPRVPSGKAKYAVSSATRICAAAAVSSPPPRVAPCNAVDERDVPARHHLEIAIAIELEWQPLRTSCLPALRRPAQVKPSAEIVAMTEDDAAFCLLAGAVNGCAQLLHHGQVKAIALIRAVESDKRDLALQLIGDGLLFAHE